MLKDDLFNPELLIQPHDDLNSKLVGCLIPSRTFFCTEMQVFSFSFEFLASLPRASRFALAILPQVTRRVPRSVHAKFHADWSKTVGARGIHTHRQTHRQSFFNYIDLGVALLFTTLL